MQRVVEHYSRLTEGLFVRCSRPGLGLSDGFELALDDALQLLAVCV
jgi:hypothetical protein